MNDVTKKLSRLTKSRKNQKVIHKQMTYRSDRLFVD